MYSKYNIHIIFHKLTMGKKNVGGGKNFKRHKKETNFKRELLFREDEQAYARITKSLGDARFECELLETNEKKVGHVRGAFRKRVWMNIGDFVLISTRNFDESKCDIIHKYTNDEAHSLKNLGKFPDNVNIQATKFEVESGIIQTDDGIEFEFEFDEL